MADPCNWKLDDAGFADLLQMADAGTDCIAPSGWRGFFVSTTIVDDLGHPLDGDYDPHYAGGCDHRDTPEWQEAHAGDRMEPTEMPKSEHIQTPDDLELDAPPAPHDPLVEPAKPAVPAIPTAASVAQVADTVDVSKFLPAGNDSGLVAVLLATLAIGGAAVKFVPNFLKTRAEKAKLDHEQRMKELELQADNQKRDDEKDEKCAARNAELTVKVVTLESKVAPLEARLADAEARLAGVEAKAAEAAERARLAQDAAATADCNLSPDSVDKNFSELSKRISKIETALKKKGTK